MTWLMDHVYGRLPDFTLDDGSGAHYVNADVSYAWTAWQARAALAQPSPVSEALIYACKNLAQITSSDGSGHADIALAVLSMAGVGDDERERLVNEWKAARAWKPSPAQVKQAEAERPEVVGVRYEDGTILSAEDCGTALEVCAKVQTPLMTVAQHERIVGELRTEITMLRSYESEWELLLNQHEQERDAAQAEVERLRQFERICEGLPQDAIDGGWTVQGIRGDAKRLEDQLKAALARVAELEKQEPVATVAKVPGEDWNGLHFYRDLQGMQPGTKLYAAPVAQAQQLHDLDKQCRDDVARALGLRPSQERGFAWSYLLASIKSCVKASEDTAQAQHSVPEASEQEKEQGWNLDYRFVERVTDLAASRTEYTTSMEATEQVLLAARELLAAAPGKEGL
ncbi:hypothetical protein IPC393_09125 [Pseudomonas aeruginosa]|nr:hypothetical protein IPC393_09125 [Pseudomonas aeruginosa]